jgi:hypothetical protein
VGQSERLRGQNIQTPYARGALSGRCRCPSREPTARRARLSLGLARRRNAIEGARYGDWGKHQRLIMPRLWSASPAQVRNASACLAALWAQRLAGTRGRRAGILGHFGHFCRENRHFGPTYNLWRPRLFVSCFKVTRHHEWLQAKNYWFVPVVAATSGTLQPETMRLLYDFARLKTDAAEQHAVANSQRRGATFARLRMEAQLYSLRASATRLTGKYWATPYASSLLPRSRARARCGIGAFAPAPAAQCSRPVSGVGLGLFVLRLPCRGLPAPARPLFFALRSATVCH